MTFDEELEKRFKARFAAEKERVDKLLAKKPTPATADLLGVSDADTADGTTDAALADEATVVAVKGSELGNLRLVSAVYAQGLAGRLKKRKAEGQKELLGLVTRFADQGVRGMLQYGPQRGGDFLNNQLRGAWAEDVVRSLSPSGGLVFVKFGPSMAAMPGEQDHASVVRTFREITLLEGKRPDLLVFDKAAWLGMPDGWREAANSWPDRLLDAPDRETMKLALAGVEVKTSLWHAQRRRDVNPKPLSVTVKDEEVKGLSQWSDSTGLPLVFSQVLLDEIYFLSFRRMRQVIERQELELKFLYEPGDYSVVSQRKSGKDVHQFALYEKHMCATVAMPDQSEAHVEILADGSVVSYLRLLPAVASYTNEEAARAEITYTKRTTP